MSNKIFRSIWLAAVCVLLAALAVILGFSYRYFSAQQKRQLKNETELAAQGAALSGEAYFDGLDTENYRITWIDAQGRILYDNEAQADQMENHLERKEVQQALQEGYGEAARYSNTLAEKQFYAAKRLPDGSVIRLSIVQMAVWTLVLGFAQPICAVILLALVLALVLASGLARRIVKPINEIDLNHPEDYYGREDYREVEPLLRHIALQRTQLKQDQAEVEKTALIRQEFTANVSHELKTPLHAISGYAELLENGMAKPEDVRPFAGKIRKEASRMTKLVEDIIDLTKLDNGGAEMRWESCDLYRIAENAVDSLSAAAGAAEVTVRLEGGEAAMTGIPQLLYSIVYNLCDNAIKYNHRGGSVQVTVGQSGGEAILKVEDTGIGIPQDSLDRIFERFYRVDKSRSKEVGGTGLGLSIVKHAVMIHGGKVEVRSEPGRGTAFLVTLPCRPGKAAR